MERFLGLLLVSFFCLRGAEPGPVPQAEPALYVTKTELAKGYYLYTISIKDGQQELGKMQFKFYENPKSSEIDYIIIPEHVRNEGKGDQLLKAALGVMKQLNCAEVKTNIDVANEPSLHLFEKNGFSRDGHVAPHALDGETVRMKKRL